MRPPIISHYAMNEACGVAPSLPSSLRDLEPRALYPHPRIARNTSDVEETLTVKEPRLLPVVGNSICFLYRMSICVM